MQYAAKTHIGLVRQLNEDGYAIEADLRPFGVAVVADGMGGHLAGEVASSLAVETFVGHIKAAGATDADPSDELMEGMQRANRVVYERSSSSDGLSGMGTTLVATLFDESQVFLGHIGDSRGYLYQAGMLRQLTDDHTLVNELFKNGQITAEEASHHPQRNIVTRAVGTDEKVQADLMRLQWSKGDILLLCSDGLTNMVKQDQLAEILAADLPLATKVDTLIDKALAAGGYDNITVVAVQNESERGGAR
ncbi:Stp1/IreP family PP2C-type Ser/Thr phosphatase [Tumebacillus sp. DT12]|uniref:Stp1/IreP family PP2C-type Ser/Thr phosphatase n=1 Tax=Tumebacillus lacus TaxID=2995335 RepID=A0ABT3WV13_9BACL|nr:Stp1/IreP family PP2C-type Ser/Thr phosphatase [Tumebacillus lacus]MCX7568426.1 Stp1/IreP family PP2C-type Ser/Thr phosphatase [Tumebacillus lacus]